MTSPTSSDRATISLRGDVDTLRNVNAGKLSPGGETQVGATLRGSPADLERAADVIDRLGGDRVTLEIFMSASLELAGAAVMSADDVRSAALAVSGPADAVTQALTGVKTELGDSIDLETGDRAPAR